MGYNFFMILVAVIFLIVAVVALCVGMFFAKNKSLHATLFVLSVLVLACLAVTCGAYSGNFGGCTIFLVLSPLPLVLNVVSLNQDLPTEERNKNSNENQDVQGAAEVQNSGATTQEATDQISQNSVQENAVKEETEISAPQKISACLHGFGAFVCSVCVFFAAMYIGVESIFGALAGFALGLAVTFLQMALKKQTSFGAFLNDVFFAVAAGLCLCGGLCAIAYAFSAGNILFFLGSLLLAAHFMCEIFVSESKKTSSLVLRIENCAVLALGFLLLFLSIIV